MTLRVGVLHTVPALVPVFDQLLLARRGDLDIVHTADASLLSRVVAGGVTDDVRSTLHGHLAGLRDAGAAAVLVTCSSIGEAAVEAAEAAGVPLTRVDAAMAEAAVQRAGAGAGRILVLATLEATLGPTTRLVEARARRSGLDIDISSLVVAGAAAARAAGDQARHDALIADAVAQAGDTDAIVLAQASMAAGAGDDPRAMTSPETGADAFVSALR
ncbi:aspartate/glutamate racemase family protein [Microbacterium sp.]|uniref:aspartate/glutamate racemase family protein n=1 Tax=Microbacterium sp. TaxID=51671 RepID=UPI002810E949|nr:aspartate/glutamate racemase family protein [Microbacterium sp.]